MAAGHELRAAFEGFNRALRAYGWARASGLKARARGLTNLTQEVNVSNGGGEVGANSS
jgi:hypothetical protein